MYRTVAGGSQLKFLFTVPDNTTLGFVQDDVRDANLGANAPTLPNQVSVSGIAFGASPTTSREVYRTVVQTTQAAALTAQLKLLTTLANNTSTGPYADSTADGSLGANAPTSDTSGITQPQGQVLAGSTTLLLAGAGAFVSTGGWSQAGSQRIRYTGITGNTLTGIPATGPGAILATITYNTTIMAIAALTGCTNVPAAVNGSAVRLFVQRDDVSAQAALAALEDGGAGDGIHVGWIDDPALVTTAMCTAAGDADLALFSRPLTTITYTTRDMKTRAGKPLVVNRTQPPMGPVTLTIQDVSITDCANPIGPLYTVTASRVNLTLQSLLVRIVEGIGI